MKKIDSAKTVLAANAIAVAVAKGLTIDEQNILGNLLALAGASLLSSAAIEQTNKSVEEQEASPKTIH